MASNKWRGIRSELGRSEPGPSGPGRSEPGRSEPGRSEPVFSEPVILVSRQSIVNPPAINSNQYIYIYIYESGPLIACGDTA